MFESISYKYEVKIEGFPSEWISLIYLYDPDLPLFPTQYIHALKIKGVRLKCTGFNGHRKRGTISLEVSNDQTQDLFQRIQT